MLKVTVRQEKVEDPISVTFFGQDGQEPALEIDAQLPPGTIFQVYQEAKALAMAGCVMGSLDFWERLLRSR